MINIVSSSVYSIKVSTFIFLLLAEQYIYNWIVKRESLFKLPITVWDTLIMFYRQLNWLKCTLFNTDINLRCEFVLKTVIKSGATIENTLVAFLQVLKLHSCFMKIRSWRYLLPCQLDRKLIFCRRILNSAISGNKHTGESILQINTWCSTFFIDL
jgi:hypothetical protein